MKSSKLSKNMLKEVKLGNMKIKYVVKRRNIKYPRLEFDSEILSVILPKQMKDERKILEKKNGWINKKYHLIKETLKLDKNLSNSFLIFGKPYKIRESLKVEKFEIDSKKKQIRINRKHFGHFKNYLKMILKDKILSIIEEFSDKVDTKFNKIYIRTQKTKWASCSLKRNLSFNLKLISLPDKLIKYIVFHELLHLKERKHNRAFVRSIKQKFKDFRELEKMLFGYWFILNKNKIWRKLSSG